MQEKENLKLEDEELEKESEGVDFSTIEEASSEDLNVETITKVGDSVKMYLREIGSIPLLTAEEEFHYSEMYHKGVEAQKQMEEMEASDMNEIDINEYDALSVLVRKGEFARDKLINSNLRLVVAICKKYIGSGLELLDLIQEGNMGLMKSVTKYDYTKGYKFSTYATWWIRQAITRAIADQSRTIRIPVHMVETINQVKRCERQLTSELGRTPTVDEVSERAGLSKEKIYQIQLVSQNPISLEQRVGEEEDSCLGDFIPDDNQLSPEEYTIKKKMCEDVNRVIHEVLTERECKVIEMRFGLNGYKQMTLEEVGANFDVQVTRERIRQIEAKAIRRLMANPKSKALRVYLRKK